MSFYDSNNEPLWKQEQEPSTDPDAHYDITAGNEGGGSTSTNHASTFNGLGSNSPTNNYNNPEMHGFGIGEYDSVTPGNAFFNTNINTNQQENASEHDIAELTPFTFIEEESQVVPVSLDHLSRDELCRMIYRLDYERNTLKDRLQAVRNELLSIKAANESAASRGMNGTTINNSNRKKRGKRKRQRTSTSAILFDSSSFGNSSQSPQLELDNEQQLHHELGQQSCCSAEEQLDNNDTTLQIANAAATPIAEPQDVDQVQKQLGKRVFSTIQSATHGARKVPKATISTENISPSLISTMMQPYDAQRSSDSSRMTKWNFTNDVDIANILQTERLIHPVKHDGSGYILPAGNSLLNTYHWARFVSMEVRYDKRVCLLSVVVKTRDAGCGRPENESGKVGYSRGESEDLPG